jgi:hypothetical protein
MGGRTRTRALRAVPPLLLLAATVALPVPANADQATNGGGSAVDTVVVSPGPGPGDGGPKLAGGGAPPSTDPGPSGSIA